MITFNVIFMPGTPSRLLPFALSLLQGTGVRLRLVGNGCGARDVDLLRAAARTSERLSHHLLPGSAPLEHGLALNELFARFPEPHFAIVDSDVIASGDFMADLWPLAPGQAAVFSASPVWATDADTVVPRDCTFLAGRQRVLHDGTPVGNTYLAIYERAALEPLWRTAPHGFGVHQRSMLPRSVQASLAARGWRHRFFDTGRVLTLQLMLAGFAPRNRSVVTLHHVGGFGATTPPRPVSAVRAVLRGALGILRSNGGPRLQRLADGAAHRLYLMRSRRDPRHLRMNARRRFVSAHVRSVIDAIRAGEPVPPTPPTDSAEVDQRVAALVSALRTHYARGLAALGARP